MGKKAERDRTPLQPATSSRRAASLAFRAILLSLLLLLQSLALAGVSAEAHETFHAGAVVTGDEPNCDARDGRETPETPRAHLHCCLLCEPLGRAGLALFTTPDIDIPDLATERVARPVLFSSRGLATHPIGWTSSWSSRAPPVVA
jgi:hypothetical protein